MVGSARRAHWSRTSRRMRRTSTARSHGPRGARRSNARAASAPGSRPSHSDTADLRQEPASSPRVPVVGIGASAGGLEAFTELLRALPNDTGMAFVFVQHLDPTHATVLTDLLSRA